MRELSRYPQLLLSLHLPGGGEGVGPTQTYYTTNASVSFTLSHSGEYTEIFHPNFFIIMNELLNQLMFKLLP